MRVARGTSRGAELGTATETADFRGGTPRAWRARGSRKEAVGMRVVSLLTACVAMSACMTDADVEPEVSTPSPTPVGHSPRVRPQYMDVYDAPPSPQITGFSPTHGGITGGTLVQIIGTAFDPNANA